MTDRASLSRFANHSSSPNCEMQVWTVFGERRVGLFALKDLKKDAEVTVDYSVRHVTVDYSVRHVGEAGLEDFNNDRGNSKASKTIPFQETVQDVIKHASTIRVEEPRMTVEKDAPPSSGGDALPDKTSKSWGAAPAAPTVPAAAAAPAAGAGAPASAVKVMSLHDTFIAMPLAAAAATSPGEKEKKMMLRSNGDGMSVCEILEEWGIVDTNK
ncbi:hypothetical protein T484DRAFT_1851642, partial [Baffinella frigidus]